MTTPNNSSGPITRVFDGGLVPTDPTPAGHLAFGRTAGDVAYPIEVDASGAVVVTTTPSVVTSTLERAVIEINTMGSNEIIAAPGAGQRIIIYSLNYLTRAAVDVRLLSGATPISGLYVYQLATGNGFAFDGTIGGLPLDENEAFNIDLSAAVGVDGFVLYGVASI